MMEGEDIDTIAQVYDDANPVLSHEDFGVIHNNHKQVEDDVIRLMKSKIANDEISKIIAHIVKGVDLDFVKQALLSPPKDQANQSRQLGKLSQQYHQPFVSTSSTSDAKKYTLEAR
eukprot:TRINITY_DN2116_c0_g2_i2.p2 TRINITY_DN2116_c0_g2~~TRINITY_DN2116_c0_g2_i2.p2  ORF type:complete len:116 (+),score=24.45 TRINITY_DN2116_c0_g2_i2:187-534(+)